MKRKSVAPVYSMCVQPAFIIGTNNEDGTYNFAPITWLSATHEDGDKYLLVISMAGTKNTKQNVIRTGIFSANLVSTEMLPLMDYLGSKHGKNGRKDDMTYGVSRGEVLDIPILDVSPWVYECEVARTVETGDSTTFFCHIRNIQMDERLECEDIFDIDLTVLDPVIYSGKYHSIGKLLGKIGEIPADYRPACGESDSFTYQDKYTEFYRLKMSERAYTPEELFSMASSLGIKKDYSEQHKKAWEFDAYNFWVRTSGTPEDRAAKDKENPEKMLKQFVKYFDRFGGVKVANICGSCGKKAIPLALLGADVTIFDISEDNKRYAVETAQAAGVNIEFVVCDILKIDMDRFAGCFDVVFMEGGILHYFHDINEFMGIMYGLLKPGGKLICSDFHPFTKIADILKFGQPTPGYFYSEVFEGEMAHARFYDEETRKRIPKCEYRKYTISEIINGIIDAGFTLERFDEHPSWEDDKLPGEFTAIGRK